MMEPQNDLPEEHNSAAGNGWRMALDQLLETTKRFNSVSPDSAQLERLKEITTYLDEDCLSLGEERDEEREQFFVARVNDVVDVSSRMLAASAVPPKEKEFAKRLLVVCDYCSYHKDFKKLFWRHKINPCIRCPYCGRKLTRRQKIWAVTGSWLHDWGCVYCKARATEGIIPALGWGVFLAICLWPLRERALHGVTEGIIIVALLTIVMKFASYYAIPSGKTK